MGGDLLWLCDRFVSVFDDRGETRRGDERDAALEVELSPGSSVSLCYFFSDVFFFFVDLLWLTKSMKIGRKARRKDDLSKARKKEEKKGRRERSKTFNLSPIPSRPSPSLP